MSEFDSSSIIKKIFRSEKRLIPERVALLKLLYSKYTISKNDPYLCKKDIAKILFEHNLSQISSYVDGLSITVENDPQRKTCFRMQSIEKISESAKHTLSLNSIVDGIEEIEKKMDTESPQYKNKIMKMLDFISFGTKTIMEKYEHLFESLSEDEVSKLARSVKNRKFEKGIGFKIIEHILPSKVDVQTRLVFDIIFSTAYCLVLRYKLADTSKDCKTNQERLKSTIENIIVLLMESQGDDGGWALRDYDKYLIAKDTSLFLFLFKEIQSIIPEIKLDEPKIQKAYDFVYSTMKNAEKKGGDMVALDTEFLLQNNMYTTFQIIIGVHSGMILLNKDETRIFEEKFVKNFFASLKKFESFGGYGLSEGCSPDIETTAFISNILLANNGLNLSVKECKNILSDEKFSPMSIINYFHNNIKAIDYFLNKADHLNVVADCITAILCCGVWPMSSQIINKLHLTCEKSKKDMEKFKNLKVFDVKKGKIKLSVMAYVSYYRVMPAIHVLHQTSLSLMMIQEYLDNPSKYWENKVIPLLKSISQS